MIRPTLTRYVWLKYIELLNNKMFLRAGRTETEVGTPMPPCIIYNVSDIFSKPGVLMKSPKCRLCGENHWANEDHKWPDTDTAHIRNAVEFKPKKSVHNSIKPTDVVTKSVHNDDKVCTQIREVSIRKLRANLSTELKTLPFNIIKNGKVIATVEIPNAEKGKKPRCRP